MAAFLCGSSTKPEDKESVTLKFLQATGLLKKASCQVDSQAYMIKRADPTYLRGIFDKYASLTVDGERYMTDVDFVIKYLGLLPQENYNKESLEIFCGVPDKAKNGRISFSEFKTFEGNLCVPDALYRTAFQLFDTNGNGSVSFDEFRDIIRKTTLHEKIPFDMDCDFIKFYFGKQRNRQISYGEFSQFLHDFNDEYTSAAFKARDAKGEGFISSKDFNEIMVTVKGHLLTDEVKSNLNSIAQGGSGGQQHVSYAYFTAFIRLLTNIDLVKKIYLSATNGSRTSEVTKEEFLYSAQMISQITPLEVDILFLTCFSLHVGARSTGRIQYSDLADIAPEQYMKQATRKFTEIKAVATPEDRNLLWAFAESAYRFGLGALAGATGATAVYPIDLVKTRMQNQRKGEFAGEIMYRNSFDCFKKVLRHEGIGGLYRGLVPQLMGVAPEKAIKLTANDFMRDKFTDKKTGYIPYWAECLAGATGGGCQVMFTNPLEIVKIRLQTAGEVGMRLSAWAVCKELGFRGLYKGSRACFMRDMPFSAIYFPAYAHLKVAFQDDTGYNTPVSLLTAGAIAGMPAASLVTPADVIKTRLQVVARAGQTTYTGVIDAARKIYAEEGFIAFWKGSVARMCRSSPQFGVTLASYEVLQRWLYIDFGGSRPSGSQVESPVEIKKSEHPDHIGGYRVAAPVFRGMESKFGLMLPELSLKVPAES